MASFNGNIGTPSGGFTLKVEYSYTQDKVNNKSIISSIKGYCKKNNSSYYPYNSSKVATIKLERLNDEGKWVTVTTLSDSSKYSFNGVNTSTYLEFVSGSKIEIPHKSDGKQQLKITFNVDGKLSSYYPVGSISKEVTLTDIPRASKVLCTSPYIGDVATITIDKKVDSFTSTVTYEIGTLKGTIATKTSEKILSFDTNTLKEEIYALMPSAKEIAATIKCDTYSDSTKIGDTQEASFNLYAKESECKPDASATVVDTNEATVVFGKLVKYLSKPKVTVEATPKYSSSIKSYSINLNDGQSSTLQEETFESIGSNSITVNATDSRGYSNPQTIELEMIDYVKLHIDNIDISRTEDVSNEVVLNANGVWFNGNFNDENINSLTASFQYNVGEGWVDGGTLTPTIDGNTFTFTDVSLGNIYDYNKEYQFKIVLSDSLMTVGSENKEAITVSKGIAVVEIGDDLVNVNGELTENDNVVGGYAIGDLYITTNSSINPNERFPSTVWEQITGDAYLKIVTTNAGELDGTSSEHKIPVSSMPSHNHGGVRRNTIGESGSGSTGTSSGGADTTYYTDYTGGGQPYYPYYYGVYVWIRTA